MTTQETVLPDGCAIDTVDIARIARLVAELPQDLDKLFSTTLATVLVGSLHWRLVLQRKRLV